MQEIMDDIMGRSANIMLKKHLLNLNMKWGYTNEDT